MKKFVLNVLLFLIISIAFNFIVFFFAQEYYFKIYFKTPNKKYSSFIMADSHGSPIGDFSKEFEVYNFSADSDSYFDIKRKIKYLLKKNYKIETIYITVDDHTLSPYMETTNNLDRSLLYLFKNDFSSNYTYLKESFFKYYLPIFQPKIRSLLRNYIITKLNHIFKPKAYEQTKFGSWGDLSEEEKRKKSENRKKYQFRSKSKSDELKKTLIDIILMCNSNDIRLIGIKFPISKSYIDTIGDYNYGADSLFYSYGLTVIDHKLLFLENDGYFENQDHLNSEGGKAFPKILFSK